MNKNEERAAVLQQVAQDLATSRQQYLPRIAEVLERVMVHLGGADEFGRIYAGMIQKAKSDAVKSRMMERILSLFELQARNANPAGIIEGASTSELMLFAATMMEKALAGTAPVNTPPIQEPVDGTKEDHPPAAPAS